MKYLHWYCIGNVAVVMRRFLSGFFPKAQVADSFSQLLLCRNFG